MSCGLLTFLMYPVGCVGVHREKRETLSRSDTPVLFGRLVLLFTSPAEAARVAIQHGVRSRALA